MPGLPGHAGLYLDELPPRPRPLPRFIPEFVMTQLEDPGNLARLPDQTTRHLLVLIQETGLRARDACTLEFNPIIVDSAGWPCLKYYNAKPAVIEDGADVHWRVRPEVSGGAHFVGLASHTLDLPDHFLGPVARVTGYSTRFGTATRAEDTVSAAVELESGVLGSGLWSYGTQEYRDQVQIRGSAGWNRFSTFGQEPIIILTADGERQIEAPYPATVQQPLIQTVVDELTGHGTCPSTGESAIRTSRVIDTLLAEYRAAHGLTFA